MSIYLLKSRTMLPSDNFRPVLNLKQRTWLPFDNVYIFDWGLI